MLQPHAAVYHAPIITEIARAPYSLTAGGFEYGARHFSLMMAHRKR